LYISSGTADPFQKIDHQAGKYRLLFATGNMRGIFN
jgi:hypothetical protein